ncbi:MAG TPA: hypothetical protein VI457_04850 [Methylococcaceae bacterium]|nr:hypothetical protein [Methylococcaceae bacterium]
MSRLQKAPTLSEAEYLAFEESAAVRREYVNGQVFAMAGARKWHNHIVNKVVFP